MTHGQKTNPGNFFEDFSVGQTIAHAAERTVTSGDTALYMALYPIRHRLHTSLTAASAIGYDAVPVDDLVTFHIVFGQTVPDISLNAVANLGYADCRFLSPVYAGDTLSSTTQIIGLRENSNGKSGIVYVRTRGHNQTGAVVLEFVRWVMVQKRDATCPAPDAVVPELSPVITAEALVPPAAVTAWPPAATAAGPHWWEDYEAGEHIDHVDGITVSEAEHMMATRLWQNTAKVHFDVNARPDGQRLIYGGHIISIARALSQNGLANAALVLGINAGTHVAPAHAGDTVYAASTVIETVALDHPVLNALRIRLLAGKRRIYTAVEPTKEARADAGLLLDLDLWLAIPSRQAN